MENTILMGQSEYGEIYFAELKEDGTIRGFNGYDLVDKENSHDGDYYMSMCSWTHSVTIEGIEYKSGQTLPSGYNHNLNDFTLQVVENKAIFDDGGFYCAECGTYHYSDQYHDVSYVIIDCEAFCKECVKSDDMLISVENADDIFKAKDITGMDDPSLEEEKQAVQNYIERDIYCLGNEFQELYAKANECWFEDVANMMTPIEHTLEDYKEWLRENHIVTEPGVLQTSLSDLKHMLNEYAGENEDDYSPYDSYFNEFIQELQDSQETQEVYQWFIVSSWLAGKLQELGEPILHTDTMTLWGRTCCGQSVELDGTLQKVYRLLND